MKVDGAGVVDRAGVPESGKCVELSLARLRLRPTSNEGKKISTKGHEETD